MMLNGSEKGHLCPIPHLSRKASSFLPLSMMLAVVLVVFFFFEATAYLLLLLFIYLFLAVLGLHCCTWAFSSCGEWGLLFAVVHGLQIGRASCRERV